MNPIQRAGTTPRYSDSTTHNGVVYCVEVPPDETAAIVNELLYSSNNGFIYPVLAAALRSIRIPYIDHNIKFFQQILICQNIIKTDKGYIKGCTA